MKIYTLYTKDELHENYKNSGEFHFGKGFYNNQNLKNPVLPISKDIDVLFKLSTKSTFNQKIWVVQNINNNNIIGYIIFKGFFKCQIHNIIFKYQQGIGFLCDKDNLMWLTNMIILITSIITNIIAFFK